jgi:hypothetical protein
MTRAASNRQRLEVQSVQRAIRDDHHARAMRHPRGRRFDQEIVQPIAGARRRERIGECVADHAVVLAHECRDVHRRGKPHEMNTVGADDPEIRSLASEPVRQQDGL